MKKLLSSIFFKLAKKLSEKEELKIDQLDVVDNQRSTVEVLSVVEVTTQKQLKKKSARFPQLSPEEKAARDLRVKSHKGT